MQVNIVGTQHLLEACRAHEPAALVIASSAAVYPIADGPNAEGNPAGPTDIYGLSKWVNEMQLELFRPTDPRTRCAAARLFNVFGPHETNPHVVPEILTQMMIGPGQLTLAECQTQT